ncbi:MAG: hypothetical protein JRG91_18125 [Deltaproteobacteria bacterium]|nr:hypothetical protein [Deltaproteobacteria bacterium]
MRTRSFLLVPALVTCTYAAAAHSQALTPEDITAVMESQAVRQAHEGCIGSLMRPSTIELVLVVEEDGKASLVSTSPALDPGTFSCLAGAAGTAAFKATGKRFQITYPMEFAVMQVAPAQPAPVVTTVQAGSTLPTRPQDDSWLPLYRQGKAMMVSGIVLTAGGFLVAGISGFMILLTLVMGDVSATLPTAGWVALGGVVVMAVGIPLLVVGIIKKRRAGRMKNALALETVLHTDLVTGAGLPALSLRF